MDCAGGSGIKQNVKCKSFKSLELIAASSEVGIQVMV